VLIAPKRGKRPDQYATYSVMQGLPEFDETCVVFFVRATKTKNPEISLRTKKMINGR